MLPTVDIDLLSSVTTVLSLSKSRELLFLPHHPRFCAEEEDSLGSSSFLLPLPTLELFLPHHLPRISWLVLLFVEAVVDTLCSVFLPPSWLLVLLSELVSLFGRTFSSFLPFPPHQLRFSLLLLFLSPDPRCCFRCCLSASSASAMICLPLTMSETVSPEELSIDARWATFSSDPMLSPSSAGHSKLLFASWDATSSGAFFRMAIFFLISFFFTLLSLSVAPSQSIVEVH
mmetsp:Transcript_20561/g.36943  ORF Transcript_20561/g.36943 Transcript_20561/m.36943 type:complete len:230 (+) Transcript_20561:1092-1781(+)